MKYCCLTVIFIIFSAISKAADFPVSAIPAALLKDANMVKRIDETRIVIKNPGRAVLYRHYAYTILSEAADKYSVFFTYYDKFRDILSISGSLYDAAGNKLKNVKKKDIQDESGNMGTHLALDARLKYHSFFYKGYPYTIEYEEEVECNGVLHFNDWVPLSAPEMAVQQSKFSVSAPASYTVRYKQFRYNGNPVTTTEKSNTVYTWEVKDLGAKKEETNAPEWEDLVTKVLVAPSNFEIAGYSGNMNSWQSFGNFMNALYAGRDVLPPEIKAKVHELTDNLKSDKDKVNTLYKFMQDNTHYISIQLGIGGWQPLDAGYVAAKKYGDCKALSNYMVALLKEAGVTGYNALIRGGDDESAIITDFPANQFNHVVVCVPQKNDSIWLECTSQTVNPGYMGTFTGNRYALLIDGSNSKIVKTPVYGKTQNLQKRSIAAVLNEEGDLSANVITTRTGLQQDHLHQVIHGLTDEEKQKRLRSAFTLPSYDIPKFSYEETVSGFIPSAKEKLELVSKNYASVSGKRIFIRPNVLATYMVKPTTGETRENDIVYDYPFIDVDSVSIKIPAGYNLESMPKPLTLDNEFGRYSIDYKFNNGQVTMIRDFERNDGRFPKEKYNKYIEFNEAVYKADNAKIVLVKQTP